MLKSLSGSRSATFSRNFWDFEGISNLFLNLLNFLNYYGLSFIIRAIVLSIIFIMSKRSRSEKGKTPESSSNPFISQNVSHRFFIIHNKIVLAGRTVVLGDFKHLNLANILGTSSLEHFVTIKEPVYPELVHYFYSNLSFQNNHIRSRVFG